MTDAGEPWWPVPDKIVYIKIVGSLVDIAIIQMYASTGDYGNRVVDSFYQKLEEANSQAMQNEVIIIMGDLDVKVVMRKKGDLARNFGLGE